jgi:hypothetical protein
LNTLGWNIQKLKIVFTVHRVDSLANMLIVFDSKSSLTNYSFDKIKFLSQLHICIILLYLIFYFSKFMFKSWLVAPENWVSVGSFLVPGNCKNAGFCTIYPRPPAIRPPLRGGGSWPSTRLLNRFEYTSFCISMQSVQITTHTTYWRCKLYDTVCQWLVEGLWFSLGTPSFLHQLIKLPQ